MSNNSRGMSNSWDRDNDHSRGTTNMYGTNNQSSNRGSWMNDRDNDQDHARFSHGNAMENRYSDDYSHPSNGNSRQSGVGSHYDQDRYRNQGNRHNDHDDNEGGFFERIGHGIRDAWNSIAGDDDDRGGNRSYNSGPPYNYGSGSNNAGW